MQAEQALNGEQLGFDADVRIEFMPEARLITARDQARARLERVEALRRTADDRFRAKEQELEQQLREAEEKLNALQNKRNDKSAVILTPEQEKELNQFEDEKINIRKQLRAVRAGLDEDIKGLGTEVKILNIVLVPFIFAVVALLIAVWHRRQRMSSVQTKENKP